MAVDTLGHLIDLTVTPASEQERSQVQQLCQAVQDATGQTVQIAWADEGYTGEDAKSAAQAAGIELRVVQAARGQKGLCAAAQALGGGAQLRLAGALSQALA